MTTYPVTIQNQLSTQLWLYDSFRDTPSGGGAAAPLTPDSIFGTLTAVGTVQGGDSITITPLHGPISVYIAYDGNGNPVTREATLGMAAATFSITSADTSRMTDSTAFLQFTVAHPNDPLSTSFKAALQSSSGVARAVNTLFAAQPAYADCTFISYLLAASAQARTSGTTLDDGSYSLSHLCNFLGGAWPSGFPDISVTNFSCSNDNDNLLLGADLDVRSLPVPPASGAFILSLLPDPCKVPTTLQFHYGLDAGLFGTAITFDLPSLTLPGGIPLKQPTVTVDINPLFKFVVFTARAKVPFNLFSSPTFTADLALTIDNEEAAVGIVVEGNGHSLLTPAVMKGVHFDTVGVGMGLFFEPPAYALGVQGSFHIGEGASQVQLDDDTFVVVCNLDDGGEPDPVYIAFYVPSMDLSDMVTMFTDTSCQIGFPVTVRDLSVKWAQNPTAPVALPDGTLSSMGYGFTGYIDILGVSFYGDVEIDASGLGGNLTVAPLSAGPLTLAGNGPGVSIKVDANGNPVRNNQIATTQAMKDAIDQATTTQLVAPGGPSLTVNTSSSPYLNMDISLSLFDLVDENVTAVVGSNGASFELDYGNILETKMQCSLADFHNFSGAFTYALNASVTLPTIAGFSLGSVGLAVNAGATVGITTSAAAIGFSLGASFNFEGLNLNIGPFDADVNISSIDGVLNALGAYLQEHAEDIFKDITGDAGKWAQFAYNGFLTGVGDIATGLKTAFGQSEQEVAQTLKDIGYGINDIAGKLQTVFGNVPADISTVLQNIGYGVDDVKNCFDSLGGDFANYASSAWNAAGHDLDPANW